jgi:hypothetical protein
MTLTYETMGRVYALLPKYDAEREVSQRDHNLKCHLPGLRLQGRALQGSPHEHNMSPWCESEAQSYEEQLAQHLLFLTHLPFRGKRTTWREARS